MKFAKVLIERGGQQLKNLADMTPLELAQATVKSGNSAYFQIKRGMEGNGWGFLDV